MELRPAEIQDAEAIVSVINAAFQQAESFFIDHDRIDLESVRQLFQKGSFLVADERGRLRGCVYVEIRSDRSYLGLLSVDPQHQKSGLGSQLMTAAEEYAAKAGCGTVEAIGQALQAGTNCGSCRAEIKGIINAYRLRAAE